MYDDLMLPIINQDPSMMIPWYLMASYLYYVCDESLLSDTVFDQLCVRMKQEWNTLNHFHKHIVRYNDLYGGSCSLVDRDFPTRIKSAAWWLMGSPAAPQPSLFD